MTLRAVILITATIGISGCAILDWIKPGPGIAVDTELVVGDKQQEVATGAVVGKKETTHNTADTIQQTYTTVNESKPDYWLYLFGLIGWILPSPRQLWIAIKNRFNKS